MNSSPVRIHKIKTVAPHYRLIEEGLKTAELRKNDRNFRLGDYLHLGHYTDTDHFIGRSLYVQVTCVTSHESLVPGHVMLSFRRCTKEEEQILDLLPSLEPPVKILNSAITKGGDLKVNGQTTKDLKNVLVSFSLPTSKLECFFPSHEPTTIFGCEIIKISSEAGKRMLVVKAPHPCYGFLQMILHQGAEIQVIEPES